MKALALSAAAAATLVGVYLALGGASYAPAKVADPCAQRQLRNPQGLGEVAQQIVLSAIDGAACKLGVTREDVVLAFANRDSLKSFAREHHVSQQRLEELVRAGLLRSIADAENAGQLDTAVADLLSGIVRRIPIGGFLDLLQQLPGS
jgi:hypothetical protein